MKQIIVIFFISFVLASCTNSDPDKPDTRSNISGFNNIVDVPKTDDIKDIYFFADEFGFDPLYQFSFSCNMATIYRIVNRHDLTQVQRKEDDFYLGVGQQFNWWDCKYVDSLDLHWSRFDSSVYQVTDLWYDAKNSKGYFLSIKI